jgi:hypothetical protein
LGDAPKQLARRSHVKKKNNEPNFGASNQFIELMKQSPYETLFQIIGFKVLMKSGQIALKDRHNFVVKKHGSITYFYIKDCELNLENESFVEKRGQPSQLCLWLHLNRSIHALLAETAFQNRQNEVAVCAQGYVLRIDAEIQSMDEHYSEWIDS